MLSSKSKWLNTVCKRWQLRTINGNLLLWTILIAVSYVPISAQDKTPQTQSARTTPTRTRVPQATSTQTKTAPKHLANTQLLTTQGDIASQMIDGIDKFLLAEIERASDVRRRAWQESIIAAPLQKNPRALLDMVKGKQDRLKKILGVVDSRVPFSAPFVNATIEDSGLVEDNELFQVISVRWPTIDQMWAEGLMLRPKDEPNGFVVAIPDADQTPIQLAGLAENSPTPPLARILAQHGCTVLVPTLINRKMERRNGRANLTSREFLYRPSFELGRHLIGYELQQVLAAVDWFASQGSITNRLKIGVAGWGEGGMLALYASAIDDRIDSALVSGYVGGRNQIWSQPIDRNVFRLLVEFGDSELLAMSRAQRIVVEGADFPSVSIPSQGGAPAKLETPSEISIAKEVVRAQTQSKQLGKGAASVVSVFPLKANEKFSEKAIASFVLGLDVEPIPSITVKAPFEMAGEDTDAIQKKLMRQVELHNQNLLLKSPYVRKEFMKNIDTKSLDKFVKTSQPYREHFKNKTIGSFPNSVLPPNARTRLKYETPKWNGYEVMLDVYEDVFAFGVLLLPKDLKKGERRPVVVCQHGLEGRPKDTIEGNHPAYHDYAAKLAERGFITFAPQNIYIFQDRFRTLQRKANPLGRTLFSIMVPQHQQIVDWLKTMPMVDADRIAFYGLSYGGKSAMRIPALVDDYCLSICSADFNEWVWKNASTQSNYSYVWTGEYEIFEFNLGSTFNYAEMATLIAPRPFMVERGHFDGVAPDETVAYEFAKVRHLYAARLGLADRCEIEFFKGPHTINGKGTFDFLHRHLKWPKPKSEQRVSTDNKASGK